MEKKPKIKRSLFRKIVNVFIGICLGLILILLLIFGFSQTKTFREILRAKVIEIADKELNGKVYIGEINGTIFTSIFLRNTSIVMDHDTLLYARNIELKTSPLQLMIKKIYVRKILIQDAKIAMLQNEAGDWNFERLIKPKAEDTSKTNFSLTIQVNDLQLKNIKVVRQTYLNNKSDRIYPIFSFDDLRIADLNLSAEAFADIQNSNYLLILKELSFKPNLSRFTLKGISGEFAVTKKYASINNFNLVTDSSEIHLNVRLDSLNLLGGVKFEDFKNCPVTINLTTHPFNFDDLSSFIGSTEILKGKPFLQLKASGKFGGFKIDKLALDYRNTHIELGGRLLNLNTPEKLFIQAKISHSSVNYKDVNALLPTLKLPEYAKLQVSDLNIDYEGEPTDFKAKCMAVIGKGMLSFDAALNVNSSPMAYDVKFETENLDLSPVFNFSTSLNCKGSLIGKGVKPSELVADTKLNIFNSMISDISMEQFNLSSHAKNSKIELEVSGKCEKADALISGNLVFEKDTIPSYSIIGSIKNMNLQKFVKDKNYESDLNFAFTAEGRHFDPDQLTGTFSFAIDSSRFRDKKIDYSAIEGSVKLDSSNREIILTSDFADFKVSGNFSLNKAIDLLTYESKTINGIISQKLKELNPLTVINHEDKPDSANKESPAIVNEELKFDYDFKFKDFELIAMLMGNDQLDISGSGNGSVSNHAGNFSIATQIKLDYIIMMQKDFTIYISDLQTDFNFTRDNRYLSFDNLFGTASLTGKRFYSHSNIKSINADITFTQSKLFFNTSANYEDFISAEAEGIINMSPREQQLSLSRLSFSIDGTDWNNKDTLKVLFNPDYFKLEEWAVYRDTSKLTINGMLENSGKQDFTITASKISGDLLEKYFLGLGEGKLGGEGDLNIKIGGEYHNPVINLDMGINNLKYDAVKLGNLKGNLSYADKRISTNFAFLDSTNNVNKPLMTLNGAIPIDLDFGNVKERMLDNDSFQLRFISSDFNISSIGNLFPLIFDQRGILRADITLNGNFKNLTYTGFATLKDAYFKSTYNNLEYKGGARLRLEKNGIYVDSLVVSNAGGTIYSGTVTGSGEILFEGLTMKDLSLRLNGDLAIMGEQSKSVSPYFYGNLLIGTDGDWVITKRGDRVFFKGDVLLKQTDLVYTTGLNNNSVSNKDFNFIFVEDSSKIDKELVRFKKVLSKERDLQNPGFARTEQKLNVDYQINIKTENAGRLVFILSQVANQKLTVQMQGGLKYSNISGESLAQGSFELMQGSKLEFLGKTFDATGAIRFENDITNPYLDITSTYTADYINPRDETATPQQVAVKIKIKGPLADLGKNLVNNQESLSIYVGARNIQNDVRETRYDYADAFSFILFGKFKDDLTAQDRAQVSTQANLVGSTATSFLGSILTNFMNSAVGDLVNNISITQAGYYTKFSVSGNFKKFRFTLGGTTETFQNISKANFGIIYNFSPKFSIRFDRKDPIVMSFGLDEKVDELALKYKFEF